MNRAIWCCCSSLALALLVGCAKKDEPSGTPAASPPVAAAPAAPAPENKPMAATALNLDAIPVEEQFEKEAEESVTPANFEQQIDAMEKELKAE